MAESMVEEFEGKADLSGYDKAAILLMAVGKDAATAVLKHLNPREVQQLGSAMTGVEDISHKSVNYVLKSFLNTLGEDALGVDASEYAQSLMTEALGEGGGYLLDAAMLGDQVKGLEAMKWMHPSAISNMLRNEHPQVVAIILSYFEPEMAAEILRGIPERFQAEVVYRIATLSTIQPRALFDLNRVLESGTGDGKGGKLASIGGDKRAAEILNYVGGGKDAQILDEMAVEHEEISKSIQDKMFVFDDIIGIDNRGIQAILADVPNDMLILAIKGADNELKEKFLGNMSQRQADIMRDDLESGGPVKLSEVEEAQRSVIQVVRRLADDGKVMMPGGGEEFI